LSCWWCNAAAAAFAGTAATAGAAARDGLALGTTSSAVDINDQRGIWSAILIQDHTRLVSILAQMQLEAVAILGGIITVGTTILIDGAMGFTMRIQHGFVDARVTAFVTLEGLLVLMLADVILQMMLELGDKRTLGTLQYLVGLHVSAGVCPEIHLGDGHNATRLALVVLHLAMRIVDGHSYIGVVILRLSHVLHVLTRIRH